jgi:hypothetical protein
VGRSRRFLHSIFLIDYIISFRLIEHQRSPIVNPDKSAGQDDPSTVRQTLGKEHDMSLFSAIGLLAREYKDARSRYLTSRQLGALPFEVQEDIGWPPVEAGNRNSNAGHWASAK